MLKFGIAFVFLMKLNFFICLTDIICITFKSKIQYKFTQYQLEVAVDIEVKA